MMNKKIETILNDQLKLEVVASMQYLAMASWAEINGYNGVASFFYKQSDEERQHMLKIMRFINGRGGKAIAPALSAMSHEFDSLKHLFTFFLESEQKVTKHVEKVMTESLEQKAYASHNFMQWYVAEQVEEENLARTLLDKLNIIDNDKGGLYQFDRDLETFSPEGK